MQNWSNIQCTVKNADSTAGYFSVYTGFGTDINKYVFIASGSWAGLTATAESHTVYLYPNASKTFDFHMELPRDDTPFICYCHVTPVTTKEVCRYVNKIRQQCHEVLIDQTLSRPAENAVNETKSRNVIKYRQETRYRVAEETC